MRITKYNAVVFDTIAHDLTARQSLARILLEFQNDPNVIVWAVIPRNEVDRWKAKIRSVLSKERKIHEQSLRSVGADNGIGALEIKMNRMFSIHMADSVAPLRGHVALPMRLRITERQQRARLIVMNKEAIEDIANILKGAFEK